MAKKKTKKKTTKSEAGHSEGNVKLSLTSMNVVDERMEQLEALFPEVFAEGQIDFNKLKTALGESVDTGPQRYGLNWAGKREAFHNVQTLSTGTLRPVPEESINFDNTENLIIEGDNLEVLKLLQKSYYGKIKMIYIDPPYNTGNEFIYPDDFREGLQTYLSYTKQVNEEGVAQTTNKETSGRFHSIWLNMMYPRLYLARNLLQEDGVIFISIDDNEIDNLKLLLNEIFGEENFFAQIIVRANSRGQTYKQIAKTHEYLLIYTKSKETELNELEKIGDSDDLNLVDNISKFNIRELRNRNPKFGRHNRPNLFYSIFVNPKVKDKDGFYPISLKKDKNYSIEIMPLNSLNKESCWRWGKSKLDKNLNTNTLDSNVVAKKKVDGGYGIYEKYRKTTYKPKSIWTDNSFLTETGTIELKELGLADYFDFPKPIGLIKQCIDIATEDGDIILDFFAGCGTTGESVIKKNIEDESDRNFILVQLPEPTGKKKLSTLAEVCKERIRKVTLSLKKNVNAKGQQELNLESQEFLASYIKQVGFKSLKLDSSNFSLWDGEKAIDPEYLENQLKLYAEHVNSERTQFDILYEILLKTGFSLTSNIEEQKFGKLNVFNIEEGALVVCLEDKVDQTGLGAIIESKPRQVICLDCAFQHNDQLKTNTVLEMKSHGITFHTV